MHKEIQKQNSCNTYMNTDQNMSANRDTSPDIETRQKNRHLKHK